MDTLYKNKGCKSDFSNQRGIFNVSKVRSILDTVLYNDVDCELCSAHPDSQELLLSCVTLRKHVKIPDDMEYDDIYSCVEKQLAIVKVVKQLLRAREVLQSDQFKMNNSHQVVMSPVAPVKVTVSQ